MDKKWATLALIFLITFVTQHLFYMHDMKAACTAKHGVLVRGATTMYECVEKK